MVQIGHTAKGICVNASLSCTMPIRTLGELTLCEWLKIIIVPQFPLELDWRVEYEDSCSLTTLTFPGIPTQGTRVIHTGHFLS